jgi:hypothetical protein
MASSFKEICDSLRTAHARKCFLKAKLYNRFAHDAQVRGRQKCYKMKTCNIETAIHLAPEALFVDEFLPVGGGLVGITFRGLGRLHVKWRALSDPARQFVWMQMRDRCPLIKPADRVSA